MSMQDSPATLKTPGIAHVVAFCSDFKINGRGDNVSWKLTDWVALQKLDPGGINYESRFKILYSALGIYILFHGDDQHVSSSFVKDFDQLFKGDVFEVFFYPDPDEPLYFEYEISPLNKELVLLMLCKDDHVSGWAPWPYEDQKVEKKVSLARGTNKSGRSIRSWTAELFIPFQLLSVFNNTPPVKGTTWKANFCRLDYDTGEMVKWAWAPVKDSFHEIDRYGALLFG